MNEAEIKNLLDELAEAEENVVDLAARKKAKREEILTDEIQSALLAVEADFQGDEQSAAGRVMELQDKIKREVLQYGGTVTGSFKQAVYQKGRITWDTKGLDGFAVAHPEIGAFRKQGDPSVVIKARQ